MSSTFSIFLEHDSGFHRLHPLTKLVIAIFSLVFAIVVPLPWPGYVVFVILLIPCAIWAGVARSLLSLSLKITLPFAISVFLIQGFLWSGGTPIWSVGPLSLKREGVYFAITSTGRILAVVASFLLLSLTTRPDHLMIALSQRGVPSSIAYIILSSMQIVPAFQRKAHMILDAQRARGLETRGSFRKRAQALLPLVEPLILGSLLDIDERAMALEARAFSRRGPKTYLRRLADSRLQKLVRRLLLLLAFLMVIGRIVLVVWRPVEWSFLGL
ncbi:MAG: energy-coupling factor transporter transmembrane protein EcfT [Anaerolineaceae bacterium]|nr:MAG: energy-coupling factor transporter transmembrane protein EcfT [Anaerolineaceae bacterium]